MSWYVRELGQIVSFAFPDTPSHGSCKAPCICMRKPLLGLPRLYPQLDPTFRHRLQALPPPIPSTTTTTPSVRKSLKITVPRVLPRTPLPFDVMDIFDDVDAWSIFAPSRSTGTARARA
jgi:hypothetical protein